MLLFAAATMICFGLYKTGFDFASKLLFIALLLHLFILLVYGLFSEAKDLKKGKIVTWVTKKGHFRPSWWFPSALPRLFYVSDRWNKYYRFAFSPDGYDNTDHINKLWGVAFRSGIHKDSVRFGYTYVNNKVINIFAYYYLAGVRKEQFICQVTINEYYKYRMMYSNFNKQMALSVVRDDYDVIKTVFVPCEKSGFAFKTWIYYDDSQDRPAHQDMTIFQRK